MVFGFRKHHTRKIMKLSLKNIGKVRWASVEINGITVIAGENNTGKSTVGRTLFSVFNSFYNIDEQILRERIRSISRSIDLFYRNANDLRYYAMDTEEIAKALIDKINLYKNNQDALKEELINLILQYDERFEKYRDDSSIDDVVAHIMEVINVSDEDVFKSVLGKNLSAEFNGQVSNIFSDKDGEIRLKIKDQEMSIIIRDNSVIGVNNRIDLHTESIYLDDPFILDDAKKAAFIYRSTYAGHQMHLKKKLFFDSKNENIINEIVANNKFKNIYDKFNSVCNGDVVTSKISALGYKRANTDKILDVRNLSTGLKTFVILKMLLLNGTIEYNGTIILDEPEIHLHPEWQLLFAELIVLIHKEFGTHILLNTHSPYFLNAIEVYAAKYEVSDKCKYYLASAKEDLADIEDVTDNIEAIYKKLARPLQDLENERYSND